MIDIEALSVPLVLGVTVLLGAVSTAWSVRGKIDQTSSELKTQLTEFKESLKEEIADTRHLMRTEVSARLIPMEADLDLLKVSHAEHRAEDLGWFRTLGERIARIEGTK